MNFLNLLESKRLSIIDLDAFIAENEFDVKADECRQRNAAPGLFHCYVGDGEISLTLAEGCTMLCLIQTVMQARELDAERKARRVALNALRDAFSKIADDEREPSSLADEVQRGAQMAIHATTGKQEVFTAVHRETYSVLSA